ncbi:MAG: hypothetical protein D6765_02875 [Bacteroidetes bacterium]|nr:MAG: hypothetical protein D6765_02875 [Bacteroidota bacterium]
MKRFLLFSLLTTLLVTALTPDLDAQSRRKKKKSSRVDEYFDESGNFASHLWYGGGFNLGFSGTGESNTFFVGISPMVGYKLFDGNLSIGPRIALDYLLVKGRATDLRIHKVNSLNFSIGAFARYKFIPALFAHVEVENQSLNRIPIDFRGLLIYDPATDSIEKSRELRQNFYLGLGYTSSTGLWGYEILFLYNLNQPEDEIDLPINFRFGITYNF